MRELEFRWKGKYTSVWYYWNTKKDPVLWNGVWTEECCQFIGLSDCNNARIFEGDVVEIEKRIPFGNTVILGVVKYSPQNARYEVVEESGDLTTLQDVGNIKIIGNIYDNKEFSIKYGKWYFEK